LDTADLVGTAQTSFPLGSGEPQSPTVSSRTAVADLAPDRLKKLARRARLLVQSTGGDVRAELEELRDELVLLATELGDTSSANA
jgi:hypothetical protein